MACRVLLPSRNLKPNNLPIQTIQIRAPNKKRDLQQHRDVFTQNSFKNISGNPAT